MSSTNIEAKAKTELAKARATRDETTRRRVLWAFGFLSFAFLIGCRQDMQDQPRYEVYEASATFPDGAAARPLVEGTVPRGYLRDDKFLFQGKSGGAAQRVAGGATSGATQLNTTNAPSGNKIIVNQSNDVNVHGKTTTNGSTMSVAASGAANSDDVNAFPFQITAEDVNRGQERYQIFCSVCHGLTGYGDGMIVRRGYKRPPSYHDDRLRQAPVGHFYDVITNGWGAMPDYSAQIPVMDRWRIIAYVRALQLSQQAPAADLPAEVRRKLSIGNGAPSNARGEHRR